jgi:hypothetical protein
MVLTAGQCGDSPQFTVVLDRIRVPPSRPGTVTDPAPQDIYETCRNTQHHGPVVPGPAEPPAIETF